MSGRSRNRIGAAVLSATVPASAVATTVGAITATPAVIAAARSA